MDVLRCTTIAATAAASLALAAGAGAGDGATTVTVDPATKLAAGATAPFDAAGVKAIRNGKAIPEGYVLVGRHVTVQRGTEVAGAYVRIACPAGKRLRTMGATGSVTPQIGQDYLNKTAAWFGVGFSGRTEAPDGTIYGVCR
jgi:hypothetical protein